MLLARDQAVPAAAAFHRRRPARGLNTSSNAPLRRLSSPAGAGNLLVCAAKKGGGASKKGGAQKKSGGALAELLKKKEAAQSAPAEGDAGDGLARPDQYADPQVVMDLLLMCSSYWKHTGNYLMETDIASLGAAMYQAPFVCLAHNKFEEGVDDPVFTYANRAALELFEGTWDEMVGMPSRLSADPEEQKDRNALIERAAGGEGYIKDYSGWRRSLKGARFRVKNAQFFNVAASDGTLVGQAVVFDRYELEDGTEVTVKGELPVAPEPLVSEEDVVAAEAAAAQQAAAVRALKDSGLNNQSPEVVAAVQELKACKARVVELQAKLRDQAADASYDEAALFGDDDT